MLVTDRMQHEFSFIRRSLANALALLLRDILRPPPYHHLQLQSKPSIIIETSWLLCAIRMSQSDCAPIWDAATTKIPLLTISQRDRSLPRSSGPVEIAAKAGCGFA